MLTSLRPFPKKDMNVASRARLLLHLVGLMFRSLQRCFSSQCSMHELEAAKYHSILVSTRNANNSLGSTYKLCGIALVSLGFLMPQSASDNLSLPIVDHRLQVTYPQCTKRTTLGSLAFITVAGL
ncbi:hypothetical protein LX36DRAFT_489084 [Colletotrichum falcatum]|nr:hypothetical protein LX36DRAFT_489084 [Colletotrichum falcatum]